MIYNVDFDNLVLSRHKLYRQGVDMNDKRTVLFPKHESWQFSSMAKNTSGLIGDLKLFTAIDLANKQARSIFAGSEWNI